MGLVTVAVWVGATGMLLFAKAISAAIHQRAMRIGRGLMERLAGGA